MNLLINYYKSENIIRQLEINTCVQNNIENEYLEKIYVFIDNLTEFPFDSQKVIFVNITQRPTFKDFFEFSNQFQKEIFILANVDIYFDMSIGNIQNIDLTNTVLALTRWNLLPNNEIVFYNKPNSQDVWIFKSPLNLGQLNCNFQLGKPRCDNVIAYELHKIGYILVNNSLSIKSIHIHNSEIRTYKIEEKIKGNHLHIKPTV